MSLRSPLTSTVEAALAALEGAYCRAEGVAPSTAWLRATGNANFLSRMNEGSSPRVESVDSAIRWFADHWPENAEWPILVDRLWTAE